jgi:hypothetical protein
MKPMPKRPYAQIHLPALTAPEALLLASILDKASDAIWRAHGKDMADFLGLDEPRRPDYDHILAPEDPEDRPF